MPPGFRIVPAEPEAMEQALHLVRKDRQVFPFLPRSVYEKATAAEELLVGLHEGEVVACLHFHHRRDGVTTIHEIAVAAALRGRGLGRALLEALETRAAERGQRKLRLKCPIDQPANGFYSRVGFHRTGVEPGRQRHVVVWELPLHRPQPASGTWDFFASLTADQSVLRRLMRKYYEGYSATGIAPSFHPFNRIIFTPLFSTPQALALFKELASGGARPSVTRVPYPMTEPTVMFDSGGYQVQMGRMSYEELCARLRSLYDAERWADYYVLPDHVPTSADSDAEARAKADDTLSVGRNFLTWFPELREQFVGVVHGRTERDMRRGVRHWRDLGVGYVAFGSFGTSGPNGGVNMVSGRSTAMLAALSEAAHSHQQRLHVFGIGNPGYLRKLEAGGAKADTFDSAGWSKMAGFGYVLCAGKFVNICGKGRMTTTLSSLATELTASGHTCPFCQDISALPRTRWLRLLHNLACYGEIITQNHGSVGLFA